MKFQLHPSQTKVDLATHVPRFLPLSIVASLLTTAYAVPLWWDGSAGGETGEPSAGGDPIRWNEDLNWSSDAAGTLAGNDPTGSDDAIFNITGLITDQLIHINNSDRSVRSLTFNSTGNTTIIRDNNPGTSTAADSLLLGDGGITLGADSGTVTISGTNGNQKVDVEPTANMGITNNSSSLLTFNRRLIGQGSPGTRTITLDGTGSGGVTFNEEFRNGNSTIALVINTDSDAITRLTSASPGVGALGGGITLNSGILVVTNADAFGTGTLALNGGRYATDGSDTTTDVVIGGDVFLGGETGEIGVGSGLDFTSTVDLNGGTRTLTNRRSVDFFGVISNGGINITGTSSSHTTRLFADNTYEGETIISLGTLALSGSGAVSDGSAVDVVGPGATFDISGISAVGETIGSLAGGSGSSAVLGDKSLSTGGNDSSTTFAGIISGTGGSLTKEGTGTMTLSGDSTYSGTTTITSGRLEVGNGGSSGSLGSGDVVNNSVLAINRSNTFGVNNDISGSGSLELSSADSGDSSIGGTNSFTGGTTILDGRFRVSNDGNLGATSSALTLDGGALKNNGGALSLDAGRSVILGSSGGSFQAGWTSDLTVNGVVSGSGSLTVEGDSGTLVLAGANTYTGDTELTDSSSRLKVTGSLGSGSTYAGEISGAGSFEFAGSGTQTLSASNTYTGPTAVNGGTLVITGATQATSAITFGGGVLGLDIATPVAAANATVDLAGQSVLVSGSPMLASYTLLTANSITGTPALFSPIAGYELQVVSNELRLVATGTPFDSWAGTGSMGPVTFEGDANGDGVQDGLAFLLGAVDPDVDVNASPGLLPTVSESGGDLVLTFNCLPTAARGTASLKVAYSTDLGTWTPTTGVVPDGSGSDGLVTFGVTPGTPVNSVTATIDSAAASGGGKLFGRLQATE